jgi:hypothetical protein
MCRPEQRQLPTPPVHPRLSWRHHVQVDRRSAGAHQGSAGTAGRRVPQVAARTEQYWCPIKHARRIQGAHDRYPQFFEYGDAESFRQGLNRLRKQYEEDQYEKDKDEQQIE